MNSKYFGNGGEFDAQKFLEKNGLKILEKNYKNKIGEIDIICFDKKEKEYAFIEVKSRTTKVYGMPCEAVTSFKQHKIRQVASLYMLKNKITEERVRFDVVEILDNKINYIKYAF